MAWRRSENPLQQGRRQNEHPAAGDPSGRTFQLTVARRNPQRFDLSDDQRRDLMPVALPPFWVSTRWRNE